MLLELLTLASLLITSNSQCTAHAGDCCLYGGIAGTPTILGAEEVCIQQQKQTLTPEEMTNCGLCCSKGGNECTYPSTCRLLNVLGYCSDTNPSCVGSSAATDPLFTGYDCDHAGTTACSTGKECAQTG
eukprot:876569_1